MNVKKEHLNATIPTKAYPSDAGWDLYTCETVSLFPGQRVLVNTGLIMEIPDGYYGSIQDKSSIALKGISVTGGVVDSSYRGEVKVILNNTNIDGAPIMFNVGQKIAQMVILPVPEITMNEVQEITNTDRGTGGFGSTGA